MPREEYLITRTACLGNDIVSHLRLSNRVLNIQKGRIDLLVRNMRADKPFLGALIKSLFFIWFNLSNMQVARMVILQQVVKMKNFRNTRFILMDTFSELVDQGVEFHRHLFACFISDLKKSRRVESKIKGLISEEEYRKNLIEFISLLSAKFDYLPIVIVEFPILKENRSQYKAQFSMIRRVLDVISKEYKNVEIIRLPENYSLNQEDFVDSNPYHYGQQTKKFLAELVKAKLEQLQPY